MVVFILSRVKLFSLYHYGSKAGSDYLAYLGVKCNSADLESQLQTLKKSGKKFLLLQDSTRSDCSTAVLKLMNVIGDFFTAIFPKKSMFEKF